MFFGSFNNFTNKIDAQELIFPHFDLLSKKITDVNLDTISMVSSALKDMSSFCSMPMNDYIIQEIETVTAFIITLFGCRNMKSALSATFLYARSHFSGSLTKHIIEYLSTEFSFEPHSSDNDDPRWLSFIKDVQVNWDKCKSNKFFVHLSKILGLLVTMGLCRASALTLSIQDYKLFEPDLRFSHSKTSDIVDAILSTVTYFVEGVYLAIKTRSFKPLLFDTKNALEIDEEFSTMILWWDLVKSGNLEKVANVSESEFDSRLERLTLKLKPLASNAFGFEKKLVMDKISRLMKIKNDYITLKISSGVRRAPFAIELYGESSQGKTTFGDQIIDALLCSAGLPLDKEYRASYNPSDKYMSNWATNKTVLIMDDVANDKADFVEKPPTRVIIDVCNNQPHYANMADLESKGKVFVEPVLALVNTNVKHLDAYTYSNCPYSIQRRMHVVITVKAKPEYQFIIDGKTQGIDSAKIREEYDKKGITPTFDDIWMLTVEKARQPNELTQLAQYTPIEWNGQVLKDVSFRIAVQYLIERFAEHRADQDAILSRMRSRLDVIEKCDVDGCCQIRGYCDKHMNAHFGVEYCRMKYNQFSLNVQRGTNELLNFINEFRCVNSLVDYIPDSIYCSAFLQKLFLFTNVKYIIRCYCLLTFVNVFTLFLFGTYCRAHAFLWLSLIFQLLLHKFVLMYVRSYYLQRPVVSLVVQNFRNYYISKICKAVSAIGFLYVIARLYRTYTSMRVQGSLEPESQDEVNRRDAEVSPWTRAVKRSLPVTGTHWTTSRKHLMHSVNKNLVYGTVLAKDKKLMVNGLFLKSNIVLIPSHYFEVDELQVTFRKADPEACGGKFVGILHKDSSYHVPNTDLMICYCSTGGSFKDITRWLPNGQLPSMAFSMLWREKSGQIHEYSGLTTPKITTNSICNFVGGEYANLSTNTFKGMCGATMVSHGKVTAILGVHLGGREGTKYGCYGMLTFNQFAAAEEYLKKVEGTLLTGTAEKFEAQVLNANILLDGQIHPKSPLNFMPHNSQVEYYGQCPGKSVMFSSVRVTPISHLVLDVCGIPNIWGPPKMKPDWFGWQECLANLAVPALPYAHNLLIDCVTDYKSDLLKLFRNELWRDAKPLTYFENTCGIPGKKFMDAIKLGTSIGFPLTGTKRNYIEELEPDGIWQHKWKFIKEIDDEIVRCESCYELGQRAYTIAKACKKDEVLSKAKCRIFYGNPIALTFLIRKYYLPILRVLQMNPLISECAVGVNSHGPEWEELHKYIHTFGSDRLIGGDYGKYDQKIPSQLILAALRIMIDFARECNYSERDISIMEAMAGDIVYAVIAFNGDLIGLTEGTHISGNSLTVVINGICGSLNQRAYFYTLYPKSEFKMNFRDYVKLMTYGDDNIGSVHPRLKEFGIKGLSEFLGEYGQIYTMPDKESELQQFLKAEDFEFLKRKSVYCPKRGCHVGALVDKSIFKMLHCYMREKDSIDTPELACAKNIDTALREWANWGEEVYERRRSEMKIIADRASISYMCSRLDVDYNQVIDEWHQNYG